MLKFLSSSPIFVIYLLFIPSCSIISKPNRCYIFTGNHHINQYINLKRLRIYGNKEESGFILGGDLEDSPPILRDVQTEESKHFVDDCLKKELSINEAIKFLNTIPEKDDDLILDNLLNENKDPQVDDGTEISNISQFYENSKPIDSSPVGTVELEPIHDDGLLEEEDEEDFPEVDIGLLSNSEMSIIHKIMREKVKNPGIDYKSSVLKTIEGNPIKYNKEELMKKFDQLDTFSRLFLELNNTVNRDPLDLQWIPRLETKIYRFLKQKNYTLSTCTWTPDSLSITLKEKNVPEEQISDIHDSLYSYIESIERSESFSGLSNIGLMVSGSDP